MRNAERSRQTLQEEKWKEEAKFMIRADDDGRIANLGFHFVAGGHEYGGEEAILQIVLLGRFS